MYIFSFWWVCKDLCISDIVYHDILLFSCITIVRFTIWYFFFCYILCVVFNFYLCLFILFYILDRFWLCLFDLLSDLLTSFQNHICFIFSFICFPNYQIHSFFWCHQYKPTWRSFWSDKWYSLSHRSFCEFWTRTSPPSHQSVYI